MSPLILASASFARRALLAGAGLRVTAIPSGLDEDLLKAELAAEPTEVLVLRLAEAKARRVAAGQTGALVIGADQVLDCAGRRFDKPASPAEARRHLEFLRGREHRLVNGLCVVRDDALLWRHESAARLEMRSFSDAFLDDYLAESGPEILESVGAYRLEGRGIQLFSHIEGDYFEILGLPLPPLLDFLRSQGILKP